MTGFTYGQCVWLLGYLPRGEAVPAIVSWYGAEVGISLAKNPNPPPGWVVVRITTPDDRSIFAVPAHRLSPRQPSV